MAPSKGCYNQKTSFGECLIYDVPAEGYDELYGKEQYEKYELVSTALRDRFRKFRVVADVGCATGLFGEYLKSIGFDGLYIGIDLSEERLKAAKHKAHASWILIQADAEHLPLRTNSVDLVACITVIHLLDVRNATKEFVRVSRDAIVITLLKKRLDLEYEILKNLNRFPGLSVKRVTMPKVKDEIFIAYKPYPKSSNPIINENRVKR